MTDGRNDVWSAGTQHEDSEQIGQLCNSAFTGFVFQIWQNLTAET
jgi:hypothetical protein